MGDVMVTVTGFVGQKPELYSAPSGLRWTAFSVASTRRVRNADGDGWHDGPTLWFRVKAFEQKAVNAVLSLDKGHPVIVTGRLAVEEREFVRQLANEDGTFEEIETKRWDQVIDNATIAIDISRGTATYVRTIHTTIEPTGAPAHLRRVVGTDDGGGEGVGADGDAGAAGTADTHADTCEPLAA